MLCVFRPDDIIEQKQTIDVKAWNFEIGADFELSHAHFLNIIITKEFFLFGLTDDKHQLIYKVRTPIKQHKHYPDYVFMSVVREFYKGNYSHNPIGGYERARYFVRYFCDFRYVLIDKEGNMRTPIEFV